MFVLFILWRNKMPKPGVIDLPVNIFPKLKDTYTEEQLKHMLIISGMQSDDSALQIFQTIPELLKNKQCISKAAVSSLLFPIVKEALEKEFIHAKLICLLNNSSGQEKISYMITTVFVADKDNRNFKLADVYLGDPESGKWAEKEQVARFATGLSIPTL